MVDATETGSSREVVGSVRRAWGRVAACACAVLALAGMSGCSLMTPTLSEAESAQRAVEQTIDDTLLVQAGTLTVGVNTSDAPQAMVSSDGVEGYAIDVASALAQRTGLSLRVVNASSADEVLGAREADLYLGADASNASASVTVWGDYLEDATAVFGMGDEGAGVSIEELNAATVGVQESSASQDAYVRAGGVGAEETFLNVNACFEALADGTVQYVVCDATAGAYLARAYPGVTFKGTLSEIETFGLAASASSPELTSELEEAFEGISSDGTLDAIHMMWYGLLPMSLSDHAVTGATIAADDEQADVATGELAGELTGDLNSLSS